MIALLAPFWKAIALAVIVAGVGLFAEVEHKQVQTLTAKVQTEEVQLQAAASTINEQNQSIQKLKAAGDEQQATIEGLAKEAQINAGKVVTQWKTKYVPTPIPVECSAAVAAGAVNAASVAQLFLK